MTAQLELRMAVQDLEAARRFFEDALGWSRVVSSGSTLVVHAPTTTVPMLELATSEVRRRGLHAIHVEVDDVDQIDGLGWLEAVGAGREERPPGRELLNVRWPGWRFHAGVFSARPPYWTVNGDRFVVIGEALDLEQAIRSAEQSGWSPCHHWDRGPHRGVYLSPPEGADAIVSLLPAEHDMERLEVRLTGEDGERHTLRF